MQNSSIVNNAHNISALLEWFGPSIRKGIVTSYNITAKCSARDSSFVNRLLASVQVDIQNDQLEKYSHLFPGMPPSSTCIFYISAATKAGTGEPTSCEGETPFTSKFPLIHDIAFARY